MPFVRSRLHLLLLPFAMAGFSLAQPVYNLLLQTPVFLVARQNTALDVWVLVFVLSLVVPLRDHWYPGVACSNNDVLGMDHVILSLGFPASVNPVNTSYFLAEPGFDFELPGVRFKVIYYLGPGRIFRTFIWKIQKR